MEIYTDTSVLRVAQTAPEVRAEFIRRTYTHLAGAIAAFVGVEAILLHTPLAGAMLNFISANRFGWLMILGAFILCGWLARGLAYRIDSVPAQYAGLAFYIIVEAIIFVPILYIAANFSSPTVIPAAGIVTLLLFGGLTLIAFTTRTDFSFLGPALTLGGFVALGLIIAGAFVGFNLGLVFSGAMVLLAAGAILYDTSKIIHHFSPGQHVAASLELFASVALMFWYVLRIMMRFSRR